jgi:hypothetical protein
LKNTYRASLFTPQRWMKFAKDVRIALKKIRACIIAIMRQKVKPFAPWQFPL